MIHRVVAAWAVFFVLTAALGCGPSGWTRAPGVPLVVRPPGEHVFNGTFEISSDNRQADHWRLDPERSGAGDGIGRSSGVSVEGKNFLIVTSADPATSTVAVNAWGPVAADREYRISLYYKGTGKVAPVLVSTDPRGRATATSTEFRLTATDQWQHAILPAWTPPGTARARLELHVQGVVHVDMVSVTLAE